MQTYLPQFPNTALSKYLTDESQTPAFSKNTAKEARIFKAIF
jgi:hypothetical protein